jgi:hypothetical protein
VDPSALAEGAGAPTVLRGFLFWYGAGIASVLDPARHALAELAVGAPRSLAADVDPVAAVLQPGAGGRRSVRLAPAGRLHRRPARHCAVAGLRRRPDRRGPAERHQAQHGGLSDGCYDQHQNLATASEPIWGDYFLLEALLALDGVVKPGAL